MHTPVGNNFTNCSTVSTCRFGVWSYCLEFHRLHSFLQLWRSAPFSCTTFSDVCSPHRSVIRRFKICMHYGLRFVLYNSDKRPASYPPSQYHVGHLHSPETPTVLHLLTSSWLSRPNPRQALISSPLCRLACSRMP